MNFKQWLYESEKEYDDLYRYDVDRYSADNPKVFSHWFPEGQSRIYLPFTVNGDDTNIKSQGVAIPLWRNSLEQLLKSADFQLADFRKGFASPNNNPKRQQRIIPILQHISKQKPELSQQIIAVVKDYEKLELRLNPGLNLFNIVISQDPHDIATMSYDKHWKMASCMRLPDSKDTIGGAKWHQMYDELMHGGLVAYLIEPEDKNIKKPLARILLRRFTNQKINIALCEETVYGLQIPGFLQAVQSWLTQHNPTAFGSFTRKGSEWSDTFPTQKNITPTHNQLTKDNQPILLDMLHSLDNENFIKQAQAITANHKNFDQNFIKDVIQIINTRFKQEGHNIANHAPIRAYTYYIPKIAMELNIPVENIQHIIKSFKLHRVTENINIEYKGDDRTKLAKYLMPVLTDMLKDIDTYNLDKLASHIERNEALQSEEFINAIPTSAIEEMMHYITNENVKSIMTQKLIKQLKKNIPTLVKQYQTGDKAALDTITDEYINPILDFLPRNKINAFFQQLKEILPHKLFHKLYGHHYR